MIGSRKTGSPSGWRLLNFLLLTCPVSEGPGPGTHLRAGFVRACGVCAVLGGVWVGVRGDVCVSDAWGGGGVVSNVSLGLFYP